MIHLGDFKEKTFQVLGKWWHYVLPPDVTPQQLEVVREEQATSYTLTKYDTLRKGPGEDAAAFMLVQIDGEGEWMHEDQVAYLWSHRLGNPSKTKKKKKKDKKEKKPEEELEEESLETPSSVR